jgi:hypothetical protein
MNKHEQQLESDNEENYSSAKGSKLSDDSQEEAAKGEQSGSQREALEQAVDQDDQNIQDNESEEEHSN